MNPDSELWIEPGDRLIVKGVADMLTVTAVNDDRTVETWHAGPNRYRTVDRDDIRRVYHGRSAE